MNMRNIIPKLPRSPKSLGYKMPAEWESQSAVWVSWPHNIDTWPDDLILDVEKSYVEFIRALHIGQDVKILYKDDNSKKRILSKLKGARIDLSKTLFFKIPTIDAWIRDYGPTFLVDEERKKLSFVKWNFNAWGGKYDDLKKDNSVPFEMNKALKLECFEPGIVLEGGSIDVNGCGTVITTEQCLLNKNRNPSLSKEDIEKFLNECLNTSNVIWLKNGIEGDDTDGHVDDIARFINRNTILCAFEDDNKSPNHEVLSENYEILANARDQSGEKMRIIKLPMPHFSVGKHGNLPASYANFYIGNNAVAVPIFKCNKDIEALETIKKCFPGREVVGIDCRSMVYGLGALHCISQQEPKLNQKIHLEI